MKIIRYLLIICPILLIAIFVTLVLTGRINFHKDSSNETMEIEDITVEEVAGMNSSVLKLKRDYELASDTDMDALADKLVLAVADRKKAMLRILKFKPDKFAQLAMPEELRNQYPEKAQENIEKLVTAKGVLESRSTDNFETKKHETQFLLTTSEGELTLAVDQDTSPRLGDQQITGYQLDTILAPTQDLQMATATTPAPITIGVKKVATILINFQNDTSQPVSIEDARGILYTNTDSIANYYKENSYNKVTFSGILQPEGDVLGYYTVPYNSSSSCDITQWLLSAQQIALSNGVPLSTYDIIDYTWNRATACGLGGQASGDGTKGSAVTNGFDFHLIVHEIGHVFGAKDISGCKYKDDNGNYVTIGTQIECYAYLDPYDVMGNANHFHMSAWHKSLIAWLEPHQTQTISSSGVYDIEPLETTTNGWKALKILRNSYDIPSNQRYIYVEYRRPIGFDQPKPTEATVDGNGVLLRISGDGPYDGVGLLDATPSNDLFSFGDAQLTVGNTVHDPISGHDIRLLSVSESGARIQVTMSGDPEQPLCIKTPPTVTVDPTVGPLLYPDQSFDINVTITNNNANNSPNVCPASNFSFGGNNLANINVQSTISPGVTSVKQIPLRILIDATQGYHQGILSIYSSDGYQRQFAIGYWVDINQSDTTPPTGSIEIRKNLIADNFFYYHTDNNVKLAMNTTDDSSGVYQYQLSNDGTNWREWNDLVVGQNYPYIFDWNLLDARYGGNQNDGEKTVYIRYKNRVGLVSQVFTSTVFYDSAEPIGSVQINQGAESASDPSATLSLNAVDSGSGIDKMNISNFENNLINYPNWEPFNPTKAWTLTENQGGGGSALVYVQYKDKAGRVSSVYSDSILLDTTPPTGSIVINNGDARTENPIVNLTVSATDNGSDVAEMRFSNVSGLAYNPECKCMKEVFSPWVPYQTSYAWDLSNTEYGYANAGRNTTVYVWFRDSNGNQSQAFDDSIEYRPNTLIVMINPWYLTVTSGENAVYDVSVFNPSLTVMNNIRLSVRVTGGQFISASDGGEYSPSTNTITWPEIPTIDPLSSSIRRRYTVQAP